MQKRREKYDRSPVDRGTNTKGMPEKPACPGGENEDL
jgi:hypothetical protein